MDETAARATTVRTTRGACLLRFVLAVEPMAELGELGQGFDPIRDSRRAGVFSGALKHQQEPCLVGQGPFGRMPQSEIAHLE